MTAQQKDSFSEFDKFVDDLERDPTHSKMLAEGRKWLGRAFYADKITLISLRLSRGLSQKGLSELSGIPQQNIASYESGAELNSDDAGNMAKELGVTTPVLYGAWENSRMIKCEQGVLDEQENE
jgi:hypothetical protein